QIIEPTKINVQKDNKNKELRVAAYCRVSTEKKEQMESYEAQKKHYAKLIEDTPNWVLSDIYADSLSGTNAKDRLEFQRAMRDAQEGKYDLLIVKSISRFARNTLDTLKYSRILKEYNVSIFFETENINTMSMN